MAADWTSFNQNLGGIGNALGSHAREQLQRQQAFQDAVALAQAKAMFDQQYAPINANSILSQLELRNALESLKNPQGMPISQPPIGQPMGQPTPQMPQQMPMQGQSMNFNGMNPLAGIEPYIKVPKKNKYGGVEEEIKDNPYFTESLKAQFKDPTAGQETHGLYAGRLVQADKILKKFDDPKTGMGLGASVQQGLPGFMNFVKSGDYQSYEQAQRNFLNAVLRKESGAVISPTEFEEGRKQYFRQPGDKPEVIKQKAANRELVIKSFIQASGKAYVSDVQVPSISGKTSSGIGYTVEE